MRNRSDGWLIKLTLGVVILAMAIPCAAVERPFNLQGTTAIIGNPFSPDGAAMEASGTATHLGNWTEVGVLFFDGSSGPPFPATAIAHFTAADGDQSAPGGVATTVSRVHRKAQSPATWIS